MKLDNNIIITDLTSATLFSAMQLAQKTFLRDDPEIISFTLQAGLNPENYQEILNSRFGGAPDLHYWVALNNNQVISLIGYYTLLKDCHEAAWLGWFCVDPKFQGKKIGLTLLDMIISHVKKMGKSYLRLYTSDIDEERRAHQIYKQRGFQEFQASRYDPRTKTNLLYFQLQI